MHTYRMLRSGIPCCTGPTEGGRHQGACLDRRRILLCLLLARGAHPGSAPSCYSPPSLLASLPCPPPALPLSPRDCLGSSPDVATRHSGRPICLALLPVSVRPGRAVTLALLTPPTLAPPRSSPPAHGPPRPADNLASQPRARTRVRNLESVSADLLSIATPHWPYPRPPASGECAPLGWRSRVGPPTARTPRPSLRSPSRALRAGMDASDLDEAVGTRLIGPRRRARALRGRLKQRLAHKVVDRVEVEDGRRRRARARDGYRVGRRDEGTAAGRADGVLPAPGRRPCFGCFAFCLHSG